MLPSKTCAACGVSKPWDQFHAKTKWPEDGTMRQPQSRCKACQAEANKANPGPRRKHDRKRYRRIRRNPAAWADHLEAQRFAYRRRRGVTHVSRTAPDGPDVVLPAEPFAQWILYVLRRDDCTVPELSARWGISDTTLRKLKDGHRTRVELATVEAALVVDDTVSVFDLYGDLELNAMTHEHNPDG